ncbi:hypothetical protein CEUSTIGMA_g8635.t1 [Chlamydomonas eustigma]|uniref:dihydrolipoyllysine-residue succinyltransferase n=1 Tax=Chlamydomonas eustigma TaxID=1157962 RepID=A0A250XDN0_9CHLO|nr:hypothetical protein CEUSTIGMA_g8635.t1 [Chlamydomonas eustigma]|eukprot:GAX81203.1 hypothetical protein CEUSTIGMA_g8635.t1 [Chlamydomonas eustigma]
MRSIRGSARLLRQALVLTEKRANVAVSESLMYPAIAIVSRQWHDLSFYEYNLLHVAKQQLTPQPFGLRGLMTSIPARDAIDVKVPAMGESVSEGTIAAVLKKAGDPVKEDDIIAQIETDKVTIDVRFTSKGTGTLTAMLVSPGDVVQVGQMVAKVDTGMVTPTATEVMNRSEPVKPAEAAPQPKPAAVPPPAPAKQAAPPPPPPPAAPRVPGSPPAKPERRVKMTRLRMRVAERLKGAQNTYAMLTTFNEVDMTSLIEMRNSYKDAFLEKHGVKLGFMSAFVRAAAEALKEVPAVNAVIDGDEIVYRDYVDISIAVATPKGLVVPVLRNADSLSFAGIEKNLGALGKKARDGTISIDDMAGGTFTISNGGVYGSMMSNPIINPPQSAILGMHAINQRAMVLPGGKIEARPMMYIALTYDHRLIDGREAVTFLKKIKEVVEDPRRILIDA